MIKHADELVKFQRNAAKRRPCESTNKIKKGERKMRRMVTRTIKTAEVEVMTIDTTTAEVQIMTYSISPQENEERYLKYLRRIYETPKFKLVKIENVNIRQELYGMTEEDFKQHAIVLK